MHQAETQQTLKRKKERNDLIMKKHFETLENLITVKKSREGNIYRVLKYNGKQYKEPYFTGQEIGWIKYILWDEKTHTYNCLIITAEERRLWLTISEKIAKEFGLEYLVEHSPLYFCIIQKEWHKQHTLPYWLEELSTYPGYFDGYEKPEALLAE